MNPFWLETEIEIQAMLEGARENLLKAAKMWNRERPI